MKRILASVLVVLSVGAFGSKVSANDFKSQVIAGGTVTGVTIDVPDNRFLSIRSFTQQGATSLRGQVTIMMLNNQSYSSLPVLSASNVPPDLTAVEPINSIVIAGPAMVSVTCPDTTPGATCFLTYRKESN